MAGSNVSFIWWLHCTFNTLIGVLWVDGDSGGEGGGDEWMLVV